RAASMDMALAATFSIGMLAWWAWRESEQRVYLALFYVFMALGTLAKGPVAPFLAAVIVVLFAIAAHELRLIVKTLWGPGILLFCAIALPWYIAARSGIRNSSANSSSSIILPASQRISITIASLFGITCRSRRRRSCLGRSS